MSLIPSESTSFPDLLGRGLDASKKSKWRVAPVNEVGVVKEAGARAATAKSAPPSPALQRTVLPVAPRNLFRVVTPPTAEVLLTSAPPVVPVVEEIVRPPVPIVPIARSHGEHADGVPVVQSSKPLREVGEIPAKAAPVVPPVRAPEVTPRLRPRPILEPRLESVHSRTLSLDHSVAPVPAPDAVVQNEAAELPALRHLPASNDEGEMFDFPESDMLWPVLKRRRRARLIRFFLYELFALAGLVSSAMIGLSHRLPNDPLSIAAKILTIASAVAVAVVPIIFYGLPETLPRSRR